MGKTIKLTKEQENKIIDNYTNTNKGMRAIGKEIGVSYKIVKRVLEQNNIPIKPTGGTSRQHYTINEEFFLTQSKDLAYILGLWGADGTVDRRKNFLCIELQRQDREILEKVNKKIGNTREVKDYETGRGYENSKIYFYSQTVKNEFKKYHIIPNKTYNKEYDFPELLSKKFYPDYIRGLFDGDGSIKITNGCIQWQLDTSCKNIAEQIANYLKEFNIITSIMVMPKQNIDIYRIYSYNQINCKKIFNLLYDDLNSSLYMKRKYDKFISLLK